MSSFTEGAPRAWPIVTDSGPESHDLALHGEVRKGLLPQESFASRDDLLGAPREPQWARGGLAPRPGYRNGRSGSDTDDAGSSAQGAASHRLFKRAEEMFGWLTII